MVEHAQDLYAETKAELEAEPAEEAKTSKAQAEA